MEYELTRTVTLPGGGTATLKVESEAPIVEAEWPILRPGAVEAQAEMAVDFANGLRKPGMPEIRLNPERTVQ